MGGSSRVNGWVLEGEWVGLWGKGLIGRDYLSWDFWVDFVCE